MAHILDTSPAILADPFLCLVTLEPALVASRQWPSLFLEHVCLLQVLGIRLVPCHKEALGLSSLEGDLLCSGEKLQRPSSPWPM